jgi:NADH:ubiquinone oxidoreductase subunit 5 (subunit L)/multisubunit Na+/H+ antiporter MnhA subunit
MPVTAGLFLSGAVAICALPPLNGFVSEILLYYGLLAGLKTGSVFQALSLMLTIVALSLAGGIAIFGFSKAFGLTFLGSPRSGIHPDTRAVTPAMIVPQMIILAVILFAGIFPMLFIHPIAKISGTLFHADPFPVIAPVAGALSKISLVGVILILLTGTGLLLRQRKLKQNGQTSGPTWGCGYPYATARQQYTAASWSAGFSQLAGPVLKISDGTQEIHPEEIFPAKKSFGVVTGDFFRSAFNRVTGYAILALKKIARLQTGNIQHYILYAFVFMLIIFILLYMRVL